MKPSTESLTTHPTVNTDIEGMRTLLNEIIRVGGTTAITNELSPDEMREWFISGEAVVSCFVAVESDGAIVGFQRRRADTRSVIRQSWHTLQTHLSAHALLGDRCMTLRVCTLRNCTR